ncbi:MAG: NAD(P)H-binding protein [Patulibacter minatonensis]
MTASVRTEIPRIAITGTAGEIGGRVATLLAEHGVAQRLAVPAARHAPRPARADVVEIGGRADRRGLTAALLGIDTFLLLPGDDGFGAARDERPAIQAALEAGVRRVVLLSALGADPDATWDAARQHWLIERDLQDSGMAWTIARAGLPIDLLPQLVTVDGEIAGPAADGRVSAVSRDDLARALVALVLGDGHDGRVYDLTGSESLSLGDVAAVMAHSTRQSVRYRPTTREEASAALATRYDDPAERSSRLSIFGAIATGELGVTTGALAGLLGEAPTTLPQWLRQYPFALVHVGPLF